MFPFGVQCIAHIIFVSGIKDNISKYTLTVENSGTEHSNKKSVPALRLPDLVREYFDTRLMRAYLRDYYPSLFLAVRVRPKLRVTHLQIRSRLC